MTEQNSKVLIPPPYVYGLPREKFATWRPMQAEASMRAINTDRRFHLCVAPTGFGKSALAETVARFMGRSCYLTETKGLQDQIAEEFTDRFDIRGKSNYDCRVLNEQGVTGWQGKVDQAETMCQSCDLKNGGCQYYDDGRRAKRELHIITNYAKWLSSPVAGPESLGEFDVLILDEAHSAVDQLCKSLRAELQPAPVEEFTGRPIPDSRPIADWTSWANRQHARLRPILEGMMGRVRMMSGHERQRMRRLGGLVRALEGMQLMSRGEWVEDRSDERKGIVGFEPVWPAPYRELLFRGIKKIVLLSATVTTKDVEMLGIPGDEVDYVEYPSSFPVARRPVIYVPTVSMNAGMDSQAREEFIRRGDQIIRARQDRNGIIHSVSFQRAKDILMSSEFSEIMMLNDPKQEPTAVTVARFKEAADHPPRILCSPSVTTGYDFPYETAEWQWLPKIPFPDRRNPLVAARTKIDRDYPLLLAIKLVVQMVGRIVRAEDDQGETIITDDTWDAVWFAIARKRFAPKWFQQACRGPMPLPQPLPKLRRIT